MLAGGSSKVSNMYLSPLLSGDLWRTYEKIEQCNLFSYTAIQKTSPNDFANVIRRQISSRTFTNVSTAPLATSSNVGRPPKYALWFIDADVSIRKTIIVISNAGLSYSYIYYNNCTLGDKYVENPPLHSSDNTTNPTTAASTSSWKPETPRRLTPRDLLRHDWSCDQGPYQQFHIRIIKWW